MKTLAIFYPGCIEFEVMLACELLNKRFPVIVATPDGSDHIGSNGMVFKAHESFKTANISNFKTVLVPGGDPASVIGNEDLNLLLQQASVSGLVIGAICAGPALLDQAGLLSGHRVAHGFGPSQLQFLSERGFFKNSELTSSPLNSKDGIVTAQPNAFIPFAVEVARLVGVITEDKVDSYISYYRGASRTLTFD